MEQRHGFFGLVSVGRRGPPLKGPDKSGGPLKAPDELCPGAALPAQAGAARSGIEATCRPPRPSTQVTRTDSPGRSPEGTEVSVDDEVLAVPPIATIVSPAWMPAASAGPPATTPAT